MRFSHSSFSIPPAAFFSTRTEVLTPTVRLLARRCAVFAAPVIICIIALTAYLLYGLYPCLQQQSSYCNLAFIQEVHVLLGVAAELVYQPSFKHFPKFFHFTLLNNAIFLNSVSFRTYVLHLHNFYLSLKTAILSFVFCK